MKKQPSQIFSILINLLNNLDLEKEYSINEISEKSGLHWKTTNDYMKILNYLQSFSPKIKINDKNKIQIINYSEAFNKLSLSQKILVSLYENKAINEKSALLIEKIFIDADIQISLEDLVAKENIKKTSEDSKYYITKRGKLNVISFYSDITKSIFKIYDLEQESSINVESNDFQNHLKQQNEILVKQYHEIKEQNNLILFLFTNLIKGFERDSLERVDKERPKFHGLANLQLYLHSFGLLKNLPTKNIKKIYRTNQESNFSFNFNVSQRNSSDYEISEDINYTEDLPKLFIKNIKQNKDVKVLR